MNTLNAKEVFALIEQRRKDLNFAREQLKQDFVGLDAIVDQVIESIKIWYMFPELQMRPVIMKIIKTNESIYCGYEELTNKFLQS